MDDSPRGGGTSVASLVAIALVVVAMWAMILAGGGVNRPLLSPGAPVAMAPGHATQG
jgi:hypothetical protein